jgi:outer membrane protein OmpA-like peptidoglycan-associated protein/tetratricopeptide (TPR) repeat protein
MTGLKNLSGQSVGFTKYNFPNNRLELSNALSEISKGDKFYEKGPGMYHLAIDSYMKANKFNPDNALLNYKIGRCYLYDNDKTNAIKYLERAYELDPRISLDMEYNDVNYLLARAYHLSYKFDKAIEKYKEHKNALTPEQLAKEEKAIDKNIQECRTAKEMVAHPERVFIDNMGEIVNSAYPEYRPLVVPEEDMIMFTSARENTTGGRRDDDSFYFEDVYATYYEDGRWTVPENDFAINSSNHEATAGISSDGTVIYIYRSAGGNVLYESRLENDAYGMPRKLPSIINDGLKQTSAALTFDKRTLYFTTKREDGYGGIDIYYSKKDAKDKWTEPVNIGATINTPYDEEGVFISTDGKTLYFSSKGHNTMGGFDIFKSENIDGEWTNPVNLGYPINTPDDDVFFTMAASGQRGYYSSKKKDGFGDQDLYMITFLGEVKPLVNDVNGLSTAISVNPAVAVIPEKKIEMNIIFSGLILDEETLDPLQATIEITDNAKNELIASFESNSKTGQYLLSLKPGINYGITVTKKGYLFHSENFDIPKNAAARKIRKDILLSKVSVGSKIVLNNIFFDFNKATLRPESVSELDRIFRLMNDMPTLRIEISGHTDNVGSKSYNKKLSEKRAKAVVDYLVDKGIDKSRLAFAGYGFAQPIASNDTPLGRQKNRRTEFKVLEK